MPLLTTSKGTEHVTVSVTKNEIQFSHQNESFVWLLSDCEFVWKSNSLQIISAAGSLDLNASEIYLVKDHSPHFDRHEFLKTWGKYILSVMVSIIALFYLIIFGMRFGAETLSHRITLKQEKQWFTNSTFKKQKSDSLTRLLSQLEPKTEIEIFLFDSDEVNAFALAGAQILVTKSLVCESKSADELLGIIAHEVGHVEKRHVLRQTLSAVGTTALVTLLAGGDYGSLLMADSINRKFSVEDEAEADRFAKDTLTKKQISSAPVAEFFERFMKSEKEKNSEALIKISEFMSDHPTTESRIQFFKDNQALPSTSRNSGIKKQSALNSKLWANLIKEAKCPVEKDISP